MVTFRTKATDADIVLRVLRRTRQIRDFRPEPVPDELLNEILEVGRWTGSAKNRQPARFVLIRDRARLDRLAELAPTARHLSRAAAGIAIVMPGENEEWDAYDEGRVAERLLVGANALDLGAGIGWATPSARAAVADLLGVTPPAFVRTFVSIGYPSEAAMAPKSAPGTARRPLADVVRYERFG